MSEDLVKEKVPDIYNMITKLNKNTNWDQIKEDLEDIFWLSTEEFKDVELGRGIFQICNRWISSHLTLFNPRYNIMKLIKVKMSLNAYFSKIAEKNKKKQLCRVCIDKIQTLEFFQKAKMALIESGQETFSKSALMIYDLFIDLRKTIVGIFMHFEKFIKIEFSKNLSEIMDQVFYDEVAFPNKNRLNQDPETKKIIMDLEKQQKIKSSVDDSNLSATVFSHKGENKYAGELDENGQRQGYGKITYYGGDIYEGEWAKNKRQGKGLYTYRFGGRYLGNFNTDLPNGYGTRIYSSGNVYNGQFVAGKKHGNGEMNFKNGDKFEGEWDNDDMNGQGKYTWASGDYFVGTFVKDIREGDGVLYLITGEIIEGVWKKGSLIS